jgi:hypothetical protein
MSRAKVVLAVIVVLGVGAMASSAVAAGEGWLIKGTLLSGIAKLANTTFVDEVTRMTFSGTEITCSGSTVEAVGPQLESPNMASATSLIFKECAVTSGGNCTLTSGASIGTVPILTEVTLDGPLAVRGVIKTQNGTNTFATVLLEGANCGVQGKQAITGDVSWLAPTGQDERTLQLLGVNITEASKLLKVGGLGASLKGSYLGKLASSLPWSFM